MQRGIRSKKELEIVLQRLSKPQEYNNELEQYPTDASLASSILLLAHLDGNITEKIVGDLGAGNGIFAIGSLILGAARAYSVEIDRAQCEIIESNSKGLNNEIINSDVSEFSVPVDTVIMNPPFGSVNEGSDRIFLEKAVTLSNHIYSVHNFKSAGFVRAYYSENAEIVREEVVKIRVPRLYAHHTKDNEYIKGIFIHARTVS